VQEAVALRMRKNSESRVRGREEKDDGKVLKLRPTHSFKGASAAPLLQCRAHHVSGTFAHTRASSGETTTHSRDALIPAKHGPATYACSHDGMIMSVTSAKMPAPITAPTFTTMTTLPDEASPSCNSYNHT
jgi:hypothetical protein